MVYPLAGAPTTRAAFKARCLRSLGDGVIKINVSDEQVEDRIDDAMQFWFDYHVDASEMQYYKYQLQAADFANKYITLPQNIIGVVDIFDITSSMRQDNLFNIRYQIILNDLYNLTSLDLVPYFMTFQHLQFLEYLLNGKQPVRYNRHNNLLYLDMDWTRFMIGDFVIVRAYQVVDPDVYTAAWSDRMLLKLATAHIKRQFGENLKKFPNIQMTGGTLFNGQQIYDEAIQQIADIEHEMIHSYSAPVTDMIG